MPGNIAMPRLHAPPGIVSARCSIRLVARALRFRRCTLTRGASVCFVGFCRHYSNLAQMARDALGIAVSAPRGRGTNKDGRCRVKPAKG
jgi:hypothetical protein